MPKLKQFRANDRLTVFSESIIPYMKNVVLLFPFKIYLSHPLSLSISISTLSRNWSNNRISVGGLLVCFFRRREKIEIMSPAKSGIIQLSIVLAFSNHNTTGDRRAPYHGHRLFVRLLALTIIKGTMWEFLAPFTKSGSVVPRCEPRFNKCFRKIEHLFVAKKEHLFRFGVVSRIFVCFVFFFGFFWVF